VSWVSKFGVVVDRREWMIDVRCLPVLYGRRLSELEVKVDDGYDVTTIRYDVLDD
jgi:hypothetical protein